MQMQEQKEENGHMEWNSLDMALLMPVTALATDLVHVAFYNKSCS